MPRRGVLLLAFGLTGCINHWQPQQGPAALVVSRSTATEFRVTRTDGTQLTVDRPLVKGDSLIGRLEPTGAWPDTSARIAIPLAEIHSVAEKEANLPANVAVGVLVTLTILAAIFRAAYQ